MIRIEALQEAAIGQAAPLAAQFRVTLKSYKGISSEPDPEAGAEELREYFAAGFPVYAAIEDDGTLCGYMVCRVDGACVWVESLYVRPEVRRQGVGGALFRKAEELAASFGENTVYNYVHPNNSGVIAFLRSMGYTVLNLIEIRKPYPGEKLSTEIRVGENRFDY